MRDYFINFFCIMAQHQYEPFAIDEELSVSNKLMKFCKMLLSCVNSNVRCMRCINFNNYVFAKLKVFSLRS